jgi:asparagine synthase (glutamine-hydrolysing)
MCGIGGFFSFQGDLEARSSIRLLKKMGDQIRYRGPDGEGQFVDGPVALCHRRLAIIDLNERSLQPMQSIDGRYTIAFNGEVYNFQELRETLKAKGCRFKTLSDTEVLLEGYRIWGTDLPRHLRGMFAFAIWDRADRNLFIARDRFGKKPLFYHRTGDTMVFGSEIKLLLRHPSVGRRVETEAIHDYFTYGYAFGDKTAFAGIRRVPPAHCMMIRPNGQTTVERYWQLAEVDPANNRLSVRDAAHELVERFDEALRLRMIADVPLGAFLSGGVDSSAVVARMSQFASGRLKTFSVGFDIEGFDETAYARAVAERYDTEHHSFMMDYDIIEELPKIIWLYGEPFSDSSALVTYALSREVRRHVTVGITGDGGDETLLGYSRYLRFRDSVDQFRRNELGAAFKFGVGANQTQPLLRDVYARSISQFREEHKVFGYGPALAQYLYAPAADKLGLALDDATADNAIDLAARTECNSYLPGDLLVKADIATMANSLEGRSPFLDHELADWCASLPQHLRVFKRNGVLESKALLKLAMEPHLPHDCMYRRKMGFSVPVKHWMRNTIKDFLVDTLTSKRFAERGLIDPAAVKLMIDDHLSERQDHGTRLWNMLCFEMWAMTFIDASGEAPLTLDVTRPHNPSPAQTFAA